ncbi:hypothetical protein M5D96_004215, partial [Drosophila gunungcola]
PFRFCLLTICRIFPIDFSTILASRLERKSINRSRKVWMEQAAKDLCKRNADATGFSPGLLLQAEVIAMRMTNIAWLWINKQSWSTTRRRLDGILGRSKTLPLS